MAAAAKPVALAVAAHPDDIEFMMAGTLILLARAGWETHYMNLADGRCGGSTGTAEEIVAARAAEAREACRRIGARFHPPIAADLQVYHTTDSVGKVLAVIRQVSPRVLLVPSTVDYMEDHVNAARVAVTAAFARSMPHFPCDPPTPPITGDVTIYHALPYGLLDPLRRPVHAGLYVDVSAVMDQKRHMLAAHASQARWLRESQAVSYLDQMTDLSRQAGGLSGRYRYAEGWQRRNHLGFSARDDDPLLAALPEHSFTPESADNR